MQLNHWCAVNLPVIPVSFITALKLLVHDFILNNNPCKRFHQLAVHKNDTRITNIKPLKTSKSKTYKATPCLPVKQQIDLTRSRTLRTCYPCKVFHQVAVHVDDSSITDITPLKISYSKTAYKATFWMCSDSNDDLISCLLQEHGTSSGSPNLISGQDCNN